MGTTRLAFLALTLTATACGSRVTIEGDDEPKAARPEPTAPSTTAEPEPEPVGLCGVPGDRPIMTLVDGEELTIVRGDGSRQTLHDLGFEALPEGKHMLRTMAWGDHLVTFASSLVTDAGLEADSVISMYDAAGQLLWRLHGPDYEAGGVALDHDGTLLVSRYFYDATGGDHAMIRDGVLTTLPLDVLPISGFVADGLVRATVDGDPAFYDLDGGGVSMVTSAVGALWSVPHGEGFLSLHEGKSAPWLFFDRHDDSQLVVLDAIDEEASALTRIGATDGYVMLESDVTSRRWRVTVPDGVVVELPPTTPMGDPPEQMSYCTPPPVLGSRGDVLMMGGQDSLWFQAFDPDGQSWETLGQPVHQVETTSAFERDGTWILNGVVGTFCPGPVGDGDEGLSGISTQVVNLELGAAHVIDAWDYASVARGGSCVAFVNEDGVHVLDLLRAQTQDVGDGGMSWWP